MAHRRRAGQPDRSRRVAADVAQPNTPWPSIQALIDTYYDIRSGFGFNKPPDVYGAFPTDPYSHTPAGQGAKQPGMTGQVKEELLARMAELGAFVERGALSFELLMLRKSEFITQETTFDYIDVHGHEQSIGLPPSSLAYTFCQVPIVYLCSDDDRIEIAYSDGRPKCVYQSPYQDDTA